MKNISDKIWTKYSEMSEPVKATLWFMLCSIIQKGIAFISTPIFTRMLTTEQYGVYSVYQSWYWIISIFATLSLSAGVYNNALTKYQNDWRKVTSSFLGLSTVATIGLFVIYIIDYTFWNNLFHLSTFFVCVMFLQLLFEPAYLLWSVKERYQYRYKKLVLVTVLIAIMSPLLGAISVLSTSYKSEARVASYALVQIIIGLIFYILTMIRGKCFVSKKYWIFALSFNLPLIPHYLSMSILNQADRIMIERMVGGSEAAIYSIAYTVASIMVVVTTAINNSFIPYTYKALKQKQYYGIKKNVNFLLIVVGLVCVLTMAFGPEVILIVGGKEYYDAIWIIPSVAASVFFIFLYSLFGNIEFYYEKTKFIMVASCIGATMNIILNYIFIPIFGYYAAGYTTLVCYMLFSFVHFLFYKIILKKETDCKRIYDSKFIGAFSIVVLLSMGAMTLTYYCIVIRYAIIVILIVVLLLKRRIIFEKLKNMKK